MRYSIHKPSGSDNPLPIGYHSSTVSLRALITTLTGFFFTLTLHAQTADGNNGLNQANTMVRSYFEAGTNLMYAVGALVGLIGALKVYNAYQGVHREDAGKLAAAWFGSCIFLVVVSSIIKAFFGV